MNYFKKYQLLYLVVLTLIVKGIVSFLYWGPLRHSALAGHIYVDIWTWFPFLEESAKGLIPYVDFSKEYPVGIGIFFWCFGKIMAPLNSDTFLNFHNIFFSSLEIFNTIIFYKILKQLQSKSQTLLTIAYIFLPTNLILTPFRYESLVNIFFFSGILIYLKNKDSLASAVFSVGSALKWYP